MIRKNDLILMVLSITMIILNFLFVPKKSFSILLGANGKIAEPVVVLSTDNTINMKIDEMHVPKEFFFHIANFKNDKINEVDFEYVIILENSVENFPIKYKLINCDSEEEVELIDGKSEKLKIGKNKKETQSYKIIFEWREMNIELAEKFQLKLKIEAIQNKENKNENS